MPHDPALPPDAAGVPPLAAPWQPPSLLETILTLVGYFALQFVIGGALAWISSTLARLAPDVAPGQHDRTVLVVIAALCIITAIITPIVLRRWGPLARRRDATGLGLAAPEAGPVLLGAVLGVIAPIVGGLLTQWLAGGREVSQTVSELANNAHVALRVAFVPVAVVVGPFAEELLFRGALLANLRMRMSDARAIGISAIAFGLVHLPDLHGVWYAVPNLVLVGLFCAWLRVRSGSLWPALVCHGANNMLAALAWFAQG